MKSKFFKVLVISFLVIVLCSCGKPEDVTIGGTILSFDKEYKDYYGTYLMPSKFMLTNGSDVNDKVFSLYDSNNDIIYKVNIYQKSLNISTTPMEEDAQAIEDNKNNTITDGRNEEVNNVKWAIVEYKTNTEDFGKDTIIHTYYALYDNMGVRMYYKIEFISLNASKEFETEFLKGFKMNN